MSTSSPTLRRTDATSSSTPLSEALIYAALRHLEATAPERAQTFSDHPELRFYGVRDIIEALEQIGATDPESGTPASYRRSTVAMRLKRMRETFKLAPRQVADAGAVRGTIGNVYALPPQGMSADQMSAIFQLSGQEATRQAMEQVNRQFAPRAPHRPSTREARTTRLYGQVSWQDARETNRLADAVGMRRPLYVAEAVRRFNEEQRVALERQRAADAQRGGRRTAHAFAPPLLAQH